MDETTEATAQDAPENVSDVEAAPKKRARRPRKTVAQKAAEAAELEAAAETGAADAPVAEAAAEPAEQAEKKAPAKRAPRKSRAKKAVEPEAETEQDGAEQAAAGDAAEEPAGEAAPAKKAPAKRAPRKTRPKKTVEAPAAEAEPTAPAETPAEPEVENAPEPAAAQDESSEADVAGDPFTVPPSPTSVLFHAPDFAAVPAAEDDAADLDSDDEQDAESGDAGRGRRSRRRRKGGTDEKDEAENTQEAAEEDGVSSRRRRRRRRGDADLELTGGSDEDPPGTVTRVRGPRTSEPQPSNKVTSVKGSTRLEAKRQRRRESRDSGRRRQVITEAEFLARRESVDRKMVVRHADDRIQIGVLEDGVLAEHFVSKTQQDSLIGNVYVGKVQNVLPSMEAAFIDIGRGRNAVLYAGEVNWDAANLDGSPRRIENALKSGASVVVQVTKDPVGHKGARLTGQISLPGRYLVYVPGGSMTGISRKLPDVERNRLKKILKDHLPENAGVIVRTAAEGASEEELMHDINRLRAQWGEIERKSSSNKTTPPELLYSEPDLTIKVVRDVFNEDFSKLVVSGEEAWDTIEAYVTYVAPDLLERLQKWEDEEDIFSAHRIDEQIYKALDRKVFLPSGGSLVIDRTEAMTVVDVNTGKFTGSGGNLEETVTKNNLEAAEEIVRQLRLRDIGGIIVIDFIDMVLESNRDLVLRRLVECLGRDRTKHQVAEVTSLGLVQMTRKRMGTGLLEVFSEDCEACAGRGVITHDEPVDHRRAPSVSSEPTGDRSSRRRRKGGEGKSQDTGKKKSSGSDATPTDEEREAKANAAREALANIAAAAHAAHEHEGEAETKPEPQEPEVAVEETPTPAAEAADGDGEPVVEIGGEKVKLPRSRRGRRKATAPAQSPELTLESLTAAFGAPDPAAEPARAEQKPVPARVEPVAEPAVAPAEAVVSTEEPAAPAPTTTRRRGRGSRVATSAQGSGQTPIERGEGPAAEGTAHTVGASPIGRDVSAAGSEPKIFGVGVPASEL
ncbi:Rne/Rng family ribonuclease [Zhihengliuella halotolerans]|uniref:Rne/Rng family ribonuclease n=1 Tax=Zhihengliuella halotolerans TaxID=370736 RepID=UPI000C7FEC18|nr:Rne/Rng family ribonuclease [Zhihengliuella halotolerans]